MKRGPIALVVAAVLAGAVGLLAVRASEAPPEYEHEDRFVAAMGDGRAQRPVLDAPLPSGDDSTAASSCEMRNDVVRYDFDFDASGRLRREREWRAEGDVAGGAWEPWRITAWTYEADGTITREATQSGRTQPEDDWSEVEVTTIALDGDTAIWDSESTVLDGRRDRLEGGRLVESRTMGRTTTCSYDDAGRPLAATGGLFGGTTWTYRDGVLVSVADPVAGPADVSLHPSGVLTIGDTTYEGECDEVVFWACSASMAGLGHPLVRGLLP